MFVPLSAYSLANNLFEGITLLMFLQLQFSNGVLTQFQPFTWFLRLHSFASNYLKCESFHVCNSSQDADEAPRFTKTMHTFYNNASAFYLFLREARQEGHTLIAIIKHLSTGFKCLQARIRATAKKKQC